MAAAELDEFFRRSLAVTFLSAVVVQELRAGAGKPRDVRLLERSVVLPFERRGRVFAPSTSAFKESGRMLAELGACPSNPMREKPTSQNAPGSTIDRSGGVLLSPKITSFAITRTHS